MKPSSDIGDASQRVPVPPAIAAAGCKTVTIDQAITAMLVCFNAMPGCSASALAREVRARMEGK
jgi:hypothetical protein